jgi:tellurite resistance protein
MKRKEPFMSQTTPQTPDAFEPHQVSNRLQFFPIMMFAISMGIGGITIAWQKAAEMLGMPEMIGRYLLYAETAVFGIIALTYLVKLIVYPKEVIEEWHHPVRINFFAAISITLLMLAIIYKPEYKLAAKYVWYAGTILHTYLTLYTISRWINHNQEINHSNPAWFIPIVGNLLVPVGGIGFVSNHILMYYFSVGLFFWIIFFAILLNRIIFHHQLPQKFMPTLFIFLAPPAVAFIAWFKLHHGLDDFGIFLFNIGVFFSLLLLFMFRSFIGLKFFISWWAFVFPVAAMAIAAMVVYHATRDGAMLYAAYASLAAATLVILVVFAFTLRCALKGKICVQE